MFVDCTSLVSYLHVHMYCTVLCIYRGPVPCISSAPGKNVSFFRAEDPFDVCRPSNPRLSSYSSFTEIGAVSQAKS